MAKRRSNIDENGATFGASPKAKIIKARTIGDKTISASSSSEVSLENANSLSSNIAIDSPTNLSFDLPITHAEIDLMLHWASDLVQDVCSNAISGGIFRNDPDKGDI